jgi:hypothetical protein
MSSRKRTSRFFSGAAAVFALATLLGGAAGTGALAQPAPPAVDEAGGVGRQAIAGAVAAYIKAEARRTDGLFKVDDPVEAKQVSLTLLQVDKDKIVQLAPGVFVACASCIATDAHTYDIDVLVKGADADHLTIGEVAVHMRDGSDRYSWAWDGAAWRKKLRPAPPKPPAAPPEPPKPPTEQTKPPAEPQNPPAQPPSPPADTPKAPQQAPKPPAESSGTKDPGGQKPPSRG